LDINLFSRSGTPGVTPQDIGDTLNCSAVLGDWRDELCFSQDLALHSRLTARDITTYHLLQNIR
jgi:hypothetical protein